MSMNTWQPTGFSAGEFARMQQDAERRVEEMQPPGPAEHREPEHTYSVPVQTIQPGGDHPASGGGAGLDFAVVGFVVSI